MKGGMKMKLYILGGDARIEYMAKALLQRGYTVTGLGIGKEGIREEEVKEGLKTADAVILGVPCTRDGQTVYAPFYNGLIPLELLTECIKPETPVLGGMIPEEMYRQFAGAGIPLIDYFKREELAILNAVPTAEGAIAIMMRELPVTVWRSKCLVTGFGRVGKYLARALAALGANVTVSVRRASDHAYCKTQGYGSMETAEIGREDKTFDVIFNTVPEKILDAAVLSGLRRNTLIIDLASRPGGVDTEAAEAFGIKSIHALSLPGRVAPETAGEILCETVSNILSERIL